MMVLAGFFPSSPRRGGRDLNKMMRSLLSGRWVTTPSARLKLLTRHLFDRAATPPQRGGEKIEVVECS